MAKPTTRPGKTEMKYILTILLLFFGMPVLAQAQTATITAGTVYQTIDGFGATTNGGNFASMEVLPSSLMDFFYTTSGIGLTYIRFPLMPDLADCTAYVAKGSCVSVPSGATLTTNDLSNIQAANARGAKVWASEWSPPASLKSNDSFSTGGSLIGNATNYTILASDQASITTLLAGTYGIPVYAIDVQNEPDISTTYASATWTAQQFHDYVPYLKSALALAGYSSTMVMAPSPSGWEAVTSYASTAMADPAVAADIGIVSGHAYSGSAESIAPTLSNVTNQHFWETEVSTFNDTYDGSMTNGLVWAQDIHQWLTVSKVNAWFYWMLSAAPYWSDNEGLTDQTGAIIPKRAYVIGNWSKFCRPGMVMVGATANPQSGVYVSACLNQTSGAFAVIAINTNGGSVSQAFSLSGLSAGSVTAYVTDPSNNLAAQSPITISNSNFSATLTANSVTTFANGGPPAPSNLGATVQSTGLAQ